MEIKFKKVERKVGFESSCPKCQKPTSKELHSCPYQCDINDDCTDHCNCCEDCTHECAMDI